MSEKNLSTDSINTVILSEEEQVTGRMTKQFLPQIPDVKIGKKIGQGGMGTVYLAKQNYLERPVAVKTLSLNKGSLPSFHKRFEQEAKLLAQLSHPNIVTCYQAGIWKHSCYIVMEYIKGPDLFSYVRKQGPLTEKQALLVLKNLAMALGYACEKGIIHRDIKPKNVLLEKISENSIEVELGDFPYNVKLADLGLAKSIKTQPLDLTQKGQIVGTPSYMAPEQFDDPETIDYRADIYGLGGVLYFMITGQNPYPYSEITKIISHKVNNIQPTFQHAKDHSSNGTAKLIQDLLHPDKRLRIQDYNSVVQRCNGLLKQKKSNTGILAFAIFLAICLIAIYNVLGNKFTPKNLVAKTNTAPQQNLKTEARSQEPRAKSQEPRAKSQEPGARSQEPGAKSQEPGAKSQEPGARSQGPRAKSQESKISVKTTKLALGMPGASIKATKSTQDIPSASIKTIEQNLPNVAKKTENPIQRLEKASKKARITKPIQWDKVQSLFNKKYLTRLSKWEKKVGAVNWAPAEDKRGVFGIGTGYISFALQQKVWRLKGSIKTQPAQAKDAGICIKMENGQILALSVQTLSKSFFVSILYLDKGEKPGVYKRANILYSKIVQYKPTFTYKIARNQNKLTFLFAKDKKVVLLPSIPEKLMLYVQQAQQVYFKSLYLQYQKFSKNTFLD